MNAQPDVKKLVQQTQRYEFSDGLRDFQLALMMLGMGIFAWLIFERPDIWIAIPRQINTVVGIAILILMPVLLAFIPLLLMRVIRKRWLWRTSGYVESVRWFVPRRVLLISSVFVFVAIAIGIKLQMNRTDFIFIGMILIGSGWSFGYTLIEMGRLLKLDRYIFVGLLGAVLGTILLFLPLTVGQIGLLWGIIWAVLLAVSGYRPFRDTLRLVREASHE